jgi:cob(I)alamin adenosyltransferase
VTRIYTKTGDDGTTGLIGGQRVSKGSPRVEAYGSVDELNALLGVVRSFPVPLLVAHILERVQDDLFAVGANLAMSAGSDASEWGIPPITDEDVRRLETLIDETESKLEPLHRFILPGGSQASAALHFARTVARRAERRCVALAGAEKVDGGLIRYLNRLSDLCFVLARLVNRESGQAEVHPSFGKSKEDNS